MKTLAATYRNPDATAGMELEFMLVVNTSDEEIRENIKQNSLEHRDWLQLQDAHDTPAIMIGGVASINDQVKEIQDLQREGGIVFAMNGASKWARENDIHVDHQVILDAKEETHTLVDPEAEAHLFSSQCNPKTLAGVNPTIWHPDLEDVEDCLPPERVKAGGYVIVGGGCSSGVIGMCLAYTQGYRRIHCFGYDGCYRDGDSHAYEQAMNQGEPTAERMWGGKKYIVPMGLYEQPASFIKFAIMLIRLGCTITTHGEGILQAIYNTHPYELTPGERAELKEMCSAGFE